MGTVISVSTWEEWEQWGREKDRREGVGTARASPLGPSEEPCRMNFKLSQ